MQAVVEIAVALRQRLKAPLNLMSNANNSIEAACSATQAVDLEQARYYLNQLDLNYIIDAMCAEHYSLPRWTQSDARFCCQLYKNFLLLQKIHFKEGLVPTREIDEFWHNHILYTQNYFQDCLNIFGYYLHHKPTSPTDQPEKLVANYLKTKQLYLAEFNMPLENTRANS